MKNTIRLSYADHFHRYKFLAAVRNLVPKCFDDLRLILPVFRSMFSEFDFDKDPLPVGLKVYEFPGSACWSIRWIGTIDRHPAMTNIDSSSKAGSGFAEAIRKWSERYNLDTPWIVDAAVATLCDWLVDPKSLKSSKISIHGWFLPAADGYELHSKRFLVDEIWNIDESWSEFEARVSACLKDYRASMSAIRLKSGFDPENKENGDRFNWLALYQSAEKSPDDIRIWQAKAGNKVTSSRISQGIKEASKLCGVVSRKGRRGPMRS